MHAKWFFYILQSDWLQQRTAFHDFWTVIQKCYFSNKFVHKPCKLFKEKTIWIDIVVIAWLNWLSSEVRRKQFNFSLNKPHRPFYNMNCINIKINENAIYPSGRFVLMKNFLSALEAFLDRRPLLGHGDNILSAWNSQPVNNIHSSMRNIKDFAFLFVSAVT